MALILAALLSAAVVAIGVGLIYLPAGVITAGMFGLAAVYVAMYVKARGG
jgi:hypothetical protein